MLPRLVCLYFILYFGNSSCSSNDDPPEIDTPLGRVRGYWKTLNDIKHAAFEGIPYAKPPVGDLRFEEPEPIPAWSGTWEANALSESCLQADIFSPEKLKITITVEVNVSSAVGSEDCLYINVYIPEDSVKNPNALDVVVAIHGGGFMVGDGQMALNTFTDKELVLVSFNYRIGILGFLSTEDDVIPGNNGLKDQVLALKWVRDNIASFGGNPRSVTIVGESAGGASVHFHYFSPLSKGLFAKGLSQSGTALMMPIVKKNALQRAKKLAVLVGCPDSPSDELKKCLKQRPAQALLKQLAHFFGFGFMPPVLFGAVVEKGSTNAFLEAEPYQLLKEGKVHDVPWITAYAAEEGLVNAGIFWENLEEIDEKWVEIFPYLLDCNETLPVSERKTVGREILDYYLGPGEKIDKKNFKKFTKIFTDGWFGFSAELAAKMQARVNKSPVYVYIFNYSEGENKIAQITLNNPEIEGVCHGEDAIYFYGISSPKRFSEQDKRMRTACHNMLYSYASSGIPSFDGTDIWQPTGPEELTYLLINGPEDMKLQSSKNLNPIDFWTNLGLSQFENVIKDEL